MSISNLSPGSATIIVPGTVPFHVRNLTGVSPNVPVTHCAVNVYCFNGPLGVAVRAVALFVVNAVAADPMANILPECVKKPRREISVMLNPSFEMVCVVRKIT